MKLDFDLSNKTAIITGASSGLGEQFARCLSGAGARVILAARRIDKLKDLALKLDNARAIEMDVSDKQSVKSCFAELEKDGEKIDICVNNAGIAALTPIFEEDDQNNFESIVQTNLMGVWYVTKAAANHMKNYGIHGSIINLTKTLVGELSQYKIRINCISLGWIRTPMNGTDLEQIIPLIPFGDIAESADLDGLIQYLASNKLSKYVTGSTFTIDGGASWGGKSW